MTTNSQNLTFGEWLAARGISPDAYAGLSSPAKAIYYDKWQTRPTLEPRNKASSKP